MTVGEMQEKILADSILVGKKYYKRDFTMPEVPGMVSVISGARRIGKTSFMRLYAQSLIASGCDRDCICYLNFFDERILGLGVSPSLIDSAYYALYPKNHGRKVYFLLDEIQELPSWSAWCARMMEAHNCAIVVTGSSGHFLFSDIATELRGRAIRYRFHPLSLNEYMRFNGCETGEGPLWLPEEKSLIINRYAAYRNGSGFPVLATMEDQETRRRILQDYFDLVMGRDLMDRYRISKGTFLRVFVKHLLRNSGTPQNYRRLKHVFDSQGFAVSVELIKEYIGMCLDSFLLHEVPIWGTEKEKERNDRKYYPVDHALFSLFSQTPSLGTVLEILVCNHLLRLGFHLNYWRDSDKHEIDFVATDGNGALRLVQVSASLSDGKMMEREKRSLVRGMEFFSVSDSSILTEYEEGEIREERGTIHIIPLFRFLKATSF